MSSYKQAAGRAVLAGVLALGGALVLDGAKPAAAAKPIPIGICNFPIGMSDSNYVLTTDLSCPGNGIQIVGVNDVHLDLGEHTIRNTSPSTLLGIGINVESSTGVHIVGGTITRFRSGILVTRTAGGPGNADVHISGVTVSNTAVSITLRDCSNCRVVDSQISGSSSGISLSPSNLSTKISNNTVTGNGRGIIIDPGVTGASVTKNVATGNGTADLVENSAGLPPNCANTWRDNTFETAAGDSAVCIQ